MPRIPHQVQDKFSSRIDRLKFLHAMFGENAGIAQLAVEPAQNDSAAAGDGAEIHSDGSCDLAELENNIRESLVHRSQQIFTDHKTARAFPYAAIRYGSLPNVPSGTILFVLCVADPDGFFAFKQMSKPRERRDRLQVEAADSMQSALGALALQLGLSQVQGGASQSDEEAQPVEKRHRPEVRKAPIDTESMRAALLVCQVDGQHLRAHGGYISGQSEELLVFTNIITGRFATEDVRAST